MFWAVAGWLRQEMVPRGGLRFAIRSILILLMNFTYSN
jgi:hypothetical protein